LVFAVKATCLNKTLGHALNDMAPDWRWLGSR
jgi:hypothetical protein